jgi:chromosome segregation ATPase
MPKSHKQKTGVRKKNNASTRKRRINGDVNVPVISLSESSTENETREEDTMTKPEVRNEIEIEDFADVSEERASIISIVKDLEGQVDTAYKLKEVLEAELDATQKELSEESAARVELEQQVKSLEAQAALAEQLREDVSFAEEERNKVANSLAETQQQLKAVTEERDSLAERTASAETHTKELENEKTALEAEVMNLNDKVTDMNRLRTELAKVKKARQDLEEQVRDLSNRLDASDTSKDAFEKDLAEAREQVENLREKLIDAGSQAADLRTQLEQQQAANKDLMEANTHLENDIKMVNIKYEAVKNELKAFKKAMHDIRSEASQTSGRIRQRYVKPSSKK